MRTLPSPEMVLWQTGKVTGRNVYGILRAGRSASTEALVLMAPSKLAGEKTNYGVAVLLAMANYFPCKHLVIPCNFHLAKFLCSNILCKNIFVVWAVYPRKFFDYELIRGNIFPSFCDGEQGNLISTV